MSPTFKSLGIDQLSVEQRLVLVQEIWDSIAAQPGQSMLSEAQRGELERRAVDEETNPATSVPWEQVKSQARSRLQP